MKLADWLRGRRDTLTVRQFAARVGVHEGTIHKWLAGENVPRPAQMAALVSATGGQVTAKDFYPAAPGFAETQSPLLIEEARALGLDATAVTEQALRKAIGDEKARRWAEENRAAIEAWNRHFEENDTPLAEYRMF